MTTTHPPIANKVVCVDFDGTIIPWGPLMDPSKPFPGTSQAVRELKKADYRVVILTSRLSRRWLETEFPSEPVYASEARQRAYIADILDRNHIAWDEMTAEKIPAEVYFDDKAVRISEETSLSVAIHNFLFAP